MVEDEEEGKFFYAYARKVVWSPTHTLYYAHPGGENEGIG